MLIPYIFIKFLMLKCTYFELFLIECAVFLYGSSSTGFGLKDSDVNLDLVIPDEVALVAHGYA